MVAFKNTVICMNDNHSYYLMQGATWKQNQYEII